MEPSLDSQRKSLYRMAYALSTRNRPQGPRGCHLTVHKVGQVLDGVDLSIVFAPRFLLGGPDFRRRSQHARSPGKQYPHPEHQSPDEQEQHAGNSKEYKVSRAYQGRHQETEGTDQRPSRKHVREYICDVGGGGGWEREVISHIVCAYKYLFSG